MREKIIVKKLIKNKQNLRINKDVLKIKSIIGKKLLIKWSGLEPVKNLDRTWSDRTNKSDSKECSNSKF